MTKIRVTVLAALTALALSACAQSDTDGPLTGAPGGSMPSTSAGQPGPTGPSAGPTTDPAVPPTAPATRPAQPPSPGPQTLTGVVTAGVEPGCVLLDIYLLVGGPRDLFTSGARVTVTGRVEPGLMSTCQQGTPFLVDSAKRA